MPEILTIPEFEQQLYGSFGRGLDSFFFFPIHLCPSSWNNLLVKLQQYMINYVSYFLSST